MRGYRNHGMRRKEGERQTIALYKRNKDSIGAAEKPARAGLQDIRRFEGIILVETHI